MFEPRAFLACSILFVFGLATLPAASPQTFPPAIAPSAPSWPTTLDSNGEHTLTRANFDSINLGKTTFQRKIAAGRITVQGNGMKFAELLGLLDTFTEDFNIVTP